MKSATDIIEQFLMGAVDWDALVAQCTQACWISAERRAEWRAAMESAGNQRLLTPEQLTALQRAMAADPQPATQSETLVRSHEPAETLVRGREPAETLVRGREPVREVSAAETRYRGDEAVVETQTRQRESADFQRADSQRPRSSELYRGLIVREKYVLEEQLGQGGMGQVWKARDLDREQVGDPRPHVAIKFLSGDFESHPDAFRVLNDETRKSQELAHPFIATVHDFGLDRASGRAFMSMELLEGQPLDAFIAAQLQGYPPSRAMPIVKNLAAGLAYAHSRKIVHSDFKPGNVFLTREGKPKILDFGIARVTRDARRDDEFFDVASLSALTLPYASPEMLRAEEAHTADDVYALGLVAYELLTGRHPFGGLPADQALQKKLVPARPRGLKKREWRAVQRALAFERSNRWPDAGAFLKALEGVSPWIVGLGAAAVVLASIAAWSGYQNWVASQPERPFEELTAGERATFEDAMVRGDNAYEFGTTDPGPMAAGTLYRDAVSAYAQAYAVHPRNPRADSGLRRTLDALEEKLDGADAETRAEARLELGNITKQKELTTYPPLQELIESLE